MYLGPSDNSESEAINIKEKPALVLNADYRPLSYYPLSLWSWQDSIKARYLNRVSVLMEYEQTVRSPSTEIQIPSVVVLKDYIQPKRHLAFTRFNLFLRDGFSCQYCGGSGNLTFDHILPKSLGGVTSWENVVSACLSCNFKKGAKSLKQVAFKLRTTPKKPLAEELQNMGRKFPPNYLHKSWLDFLYWDEILEI